MNRQFWLDRLERTKTAIVSLEDAIDAIVVGGVESYTINTGQTTQTVTRSNLATYNSQLSNLYNRLATLEARLYGSGTTNMGAGW